MKKIIISILVFIGIFAILFLIQKNTKIFTPENKQTEQKTPYVSYNKWLHIDKTQIKNEKDEPFRLTGVSSHGIQWYSDVITYDNLKHLKEEWGINTFRIAMYTEDDGYISNPDEIKSKLIEITDMVIDLDMYAIIDWHILSDNDPNKHIEESKQFFNEISEKYADTPNIIYEICNEPNANYVTWKEYIKPYAEEIIPIIRENSPKSVIIVGTPQWCKDLDSVSKSPLKYENILYACHFYSGTHTNTLRDTVQKNIDNRTTNNNLRMWNNRLKRKRKPRHRRISKLDRPPRQKQHKLDKLVILKQKRNLSNPNPRLHPNHPNRRPPNPIRPIHKTTNTKIQKLKQKR